MIGVDLLFQPDLMLQVLILVPAVAILGLPHGALDLPIAQSLWSLKGWRGTAAFSAIYLGLSLLLVAFWIAFPGPALCVFLVYSAVHFSGDWDDAGRAQRWIGGVATVGAPALFRADEVAAIFSYLAPADAANFAAQGLAIMGAFALMSYLSLFIFRSNFRDRAAIEIGVIWIAAACLAPLVYFIVYFCALHSVRHFTDALASLDRKKQALGVAIVVSGVTVLIGLLAFINLPDAGSDTLQQPIVQVVFIGLAALTVPHMILVECFQSRAVRQPDRC
ncbi:Brp/Blh family beta-carotene 15,15'-dioxygenase [Loktanella sp. SALINAS62]|uniref:Brp/Blh family beta-carotene 15,15'-dioxygenase n=1 Tax=Loktanella sp. SALINAS62 TaxID=2706124 RepID=UPI002010D557|nr:Brp/Blh family beta-carotene 15,15'-dioxygenase [Loktanella sp. SALINAS62]